MHRMQHGLRSPHDGGSCAPVKMVVPISVAVGHRGPIADDSGHPHTHCRTRLRRVALLPGDGCAAAAITVLPEFDPVAVQAGSSQAWTTMCVAVSGLRSYVTRTWASVTGVTSDPPASSHSRSTSQRSACPSYQSLLTS